MINVALIGAGYWGEKYIKTLHNMKDVHLSWIVKSRKQLMFSLDHTKITTDINKVLNDKKVNCIIIATPAKTHFEIAKKCIEARKHVLVEKPFTTNSNQARKLIKLNKDKNLVVMPAHIYLFHPAIQKLKDLINFEQGKVFSKRMSSYKYSDALAEIAIHDLYILKYLFGNQIKVKGVMGKVSHCISNIMFNEIEAFIESSTDYPGKVREMLIKKNKSNLKIIFDETVNHKLTINGKPVEIDESISPLEKQCKHFFECVKGKDTPNVNEQDGLETIELIEKLYGEIT